MNVTVVTVSNRVPQEPYYLYEQFHKSLSRHKVTPLILGGGFDKGTYGGLGSKPRLLKAAIEKGLIKTDHIIFTDCWDVVFASSPEDILEKYLHTHGHGDAPIVWNAEKNCFPNADLSSQHPETESPFKYLNSGLAIGKTSDFYAALVEMKADTIPDDHRGVDGNMVEPIDQNNWMELLCGGATWMKLDNWCEFFQTLTEVEIGELSFKGKHIENVVTKSFPMVFHANGPSKESPVTKLILSHLKL